MALISIVTPVYNNALSLSDLLAKFQNLPFDKETDPVEFVFVDDGSWDNSFEVLVSLAQTDPRIHIVKLSRNFGSNAAIMAGLSQASGQAIIAIAADLQDPPELIPEMVAKWREGNKVVLAARNSRDDGWLNEKLSDWFYLLFRKLAIKTMPEHGFDFFLIDRQVCDIINNVQENNAYLMGLILWLGFNPVVLTYDRQPRKSRYGHSMWTTAKKIKYFIDSFVAFSYFPVRATSFLGIATSIIGLMYALIIISQRLLFRIDVEGWASLIVVLLIVSGVQMMMVGILGEYLWRNLDETRKRPRFIIEKLVNCDTAS